MSGDPCVNFGKIRKLYQIDCQPPGNHYLRIMVSADNLEYLKAAAGALTGVGSLMSFLFRKQLKAWWGKRKEYKKMVREMPYTLLNLLKRVEGLEAAGVERDAQVKSIFSEMHTNGGSSLRDAINRMELENKYSFWHKPFPAFRITRDGRIYAVSQAYMDLVKTTTEFDLTGLSWRQFEYDGEKGDKFFKRWREVASVQSTFAGLLEIRSNDGDYRGEWLIKIFPLGSYNGDGIFSGAFYPSDEVAKKIATENRWFGQS